MGAVLDSDGFTNTGAAYMLFLETNGNVKSTQKISALYGNFNAFYTLVEGDQLGTGAEALGDIDGDGVMDLALSAGADDDGLSAAGAIYLLSLETNGNIKNAHKISMLYGNFNAFYTLETSYLGTGMAALGDIDGDGVIDFAVGAPLDDDGGTNAGAVYIINLQQSYCESPAPTVSPMAGTCYHHSSTVTRLKSNGQGMAQVALKDAVEGDRVLALDQDTKPIFAKIEALPHSSAEEPYVHIVMKGKERRELKATLHHTFDACSNERSPFAFKPFRNFIVAAKDVRVGDCLHTTDGEARVHSTKHVAIKDGDETYSIKLEGGAGTVAIGGVFTHALDYVLLPGRHGAN